MSKQRAWRKEPCPEESRIIMILPLSLSVSSAPSSLIFLCSGTPHASCHFTPSHCHMHVCTDMILQDHRPLSHPEEQSFLHILHYLALIRFPRFFHIFLGVVGWFHLGSTPGLPLYLAAMSFLPWLFQLRQTASLSSPLLLIHGEKTASVVP